MGALNKVAALEGHTDRVWSLAWCPDGSCLASCSGDRSVRIWECLPDSETWYCKSLLEHSHTKTVRSISWSPGGLNLATASFDGKTVIWRRDQVDQWREATHLEGHENEVKCVAFSPSGTLLATCGRDKTVWVWESFPSDDYECVDVKQGHSADVKAVAWHPESGVLASASYDNSIKLWKEDADGSEWYCAQTLEGISLGHDNTVWTVDFTRDGTLMASGSEDKSVKVWECASSRDGEPFYRLKATLTGLHERAVYKVAWSAENRLATACGDNAIRIFEQQEGAWVCTAAQAGAHSQDVNCVAWHPVQADLIASCSDDGSVTLWRHTS